MPDRYTECECCGTKTTELMADYRGEGGHISKFWVCVNCMGKTDKSFFATLHRTAVAYRQTHQPDLTAQVKAEQGFPRPTNPEDEFPF